MVERDFFSSSRCASGKRHGGGTCGTAKVTFRPGSGETLRDRHQRRGSFHAAAACGGLSGWRFPASSFVANERGDAKRFDVHSSATADRGRQEGGISKPGLHLSQHFFLL